MKTILYATDYSQNSVAALKYAHKLGKDLNAALLVVHVFDIPTLRQSRGKHALPDLESDALKRHTEQLESFCKQHLGSDFKEMNAEVEAIPNKSAVEGIISTAERLQSLLIVTGMKGESKLRRLIMGSTARTLIEEAPYPVLTIPADTLYSPIKTIVYATDFEDEDLGAINKLAEIAEPLHAKIAIVHVSPLDAKIDDEWQKILKEKVDKHVGYANRDLEILYSDDVFNELIHCVNEKKADVIAMLERESTSYSSQMFYRNLLRKMRSYGKIPLMNFNAKNYGMFHV